MAPVADILIAMKLTASQDRDAIGAWIEVEPLRQGRDAAGAEPTWRSRFWSSVETRA
jgi:hypothetical protein